MRTLILGLDAFDPGLFEKLYNQGHMNNLAKYVRNKQYSRFQVANPPQSEVSWTSIATGLNPGHHGLFDFVHRNPQDYSLNVSLLPSAAGVGGSQFVRPYTTRTIFDWAAEQGYPATTLWWPATFPAQPESPVHTLPGLGTPDIQGRLGIGQFFSTNPDDASASRKTPLSVFERSSRAVYTQSLDGPRMQTRQGYQPAKIPFTLEVIDDEYAQLKIDGQCIDLRLGILGPYLELNVKMGLFVNIGAVTRAILTQTTPNVQLYFLPLQLHPLKSPWRYGTPRSFVKECWTNFGPFLTIGWPQDTQALEDGILTDDQFLDLCDQIVAKQVQLLFYQLDRFEEGIIGAVIDTLDRVQHMFWNTRPEVVERWYLKLDELVGQVEWAFSAHSTPEDRLLVVSDHGFTHYDAKVHLNRWLLEQGLLIEKNSTQSGEWADIDWTRTQAYAIGLNSIYLNLAGREGQGLVASGQQEGLLEKIRLGLLDWKGADGKPVVRNAWPRGEAFDGPSG